MVHRSLALFLVLLLVGNGQGEIVAGNAKVDAARNAQNGAAASDTADHQTIGAGLWVLNAGVMAEDLQVIKALLYAENDPKLRLVEAHARRIIACKRFSDEAEKAFGAQMSAQLDLMDLSAFGMGLLSPTWEIHGNTASPAAEDAAGLARNQIILPPLINCRGVWKVDVTPTPTPTPQDVDALASAIDKYAAMVDGVTKAIEDGKLRTVAEVKDALKALPKFARPVEYTPDVVLSLPTASRTATAPAQSGNGISE